MHLQIQVRTLNSFSKKSGSILTSCWYHSGLGGSEVSSEIEVGFFSSNMANVLTLSSLQTLHLVLPRFG